MKLILALLLFVSFCFAEPLDVQFSTFGGWPLCDFIPGCIDATPLYFILVKPSGSDVIGFDYTLTYSVNGAVQTIAGTIPRADSPEGYSESEILSLGGHVNLISLVVTEKL